MIFHKKKRTKYGATSTRQNISFLDETIADILVFYEYNDYGDMIAVMARMECEKCKFKLEVKIDVEKRDICNKGDESYYEISIKIVTNSAIIELLSKYNEHLRNAHMQPLTEEPE